MQEGNEGMDVTCTHEPRSAKVRYPDGTLGCYWCYPFPRVHQKHFWSDKAQLPTPKNSATPEYNRLQRARLREIKSAVD